MNKICHRYYVWLLAVAFFSITTAAVFEKANKTTNCILRVKDPVKNLHKLGVIQFDEFREHHIWLGKAGGYLRDDVLYDRRTDNLNFDGLYKVSRGGDVWYFRFGGQAFDTDKSARTLLYDVQWSDGKFPGFPGKYSLDIVGVDSSGGGA